MGIKNHKVRGILIFFTICISLQEKKMLCYNSSIFPATHFLGVLKIQAEGILKQWESWDTKLCYLLIIGPF